jgi:hypothetical protein
MLVHLDDDTGSVGTDQDLELEDSEHEQEDQHLYAQLPPPDTTRYSATLDQRLRRELADAGFLDYRLAAKDHQEDDEICLELRRLQSKLCQSSMLNQYRKRRVAERIRDRVLPAQELYHLVDEIDKQLASVYVKLVRNRKKSGGGGQAAKKGGPSQSESGLGEVQRLVTNRAKLLEAFAPSVGPRSVYLGTAFGERLFEQSVETRLRDDAKQLGLWFMME